MIDILRDLEYVDGGIYTLMKLYTGSNTDLKDALSTWDELLRDVIGELRKKTNDKMEQFDL